MNGFQSLVPISTLADFEVEDLTKIMLGQEDIDIAAIEALANYQGGYEEMSLQVQWFWDVFRAFSAEEQRATLKFVTGLHKVLGPSSAYCAAVPSLTAARLHICLQLIFV